MNRRVVFAGVAALALILVLVTGATVAIAALAANALTQSGPSTTISTSRPDAGLPPTQAASPALPSDAALTPQPLHGTTPTVTDAQITTFAMGVSTDDPANARIWGQEQIIVTHCMAGKGWDYDPRNLSSAPIRDWDPAAVLALYGNTGGGDAYRWQDAGCDGYAVHVTGNDNNN